MIGGGGWRGRSRRLGWGVSEWGHDDRGMEGMDAQGR